MLDTRSTLPKAESAERFDRGINVRPIASFGLGSLRSRKKLLALGTAIFLVLGLFYTLHRPTTYTASSQLLVYVKRVMTGPDLSILQSRADLPLVENQMQLLHSGNVLVELVKTLRLDQDLEFTGDHSLSARLWAWVSSKQHVRTGGAAFGAAVDAVSRNLKIRQVGTSHLIAVSFTASEPEKAARIVNALVRIYLKELSRVSDAGSSEVPALREIFQNLGPSALVVAAAEPPIRADGPPAALTVIGAALLGLCIAAAVAILLDAINDTIRNGRQLEYALGLECLGVIPTRASTPTALDGATEFSRAFDEPALRGVVAALIDASLGGVRTVGVTSALPGEGTTTIVVGVARELAASGKRVLVIDGGSENPSITRWAASAPGPVTWSHRGSRSAALDDVVAVEAGLDVLPLAELADGWPCSACSASLDKNRRNTMEAYDFVIVDMPALAAGPDVRAAAQSSDSFLLVVKWGATESELVRQALSSAGESRSKFIGAVLNMADEKTMRHYGNGPLSELKVSTAS